METHSFRLAALAADVRMQDHGHFDAVLKTIDELIAQLGEEEQADIKKVDECRESYQTIESKSKDMEWKIENNGAKIQTHAKAIGQKTEAKKQTIKDIETADATLKEMLKDRTAENGAFVAAKSDDVKAIALLKKAKGALSEYFDKNNAFLQQEPEMKLSGKDNASGQTNGVLKLLDMIIEDLTGEIAEGQASEKASQLDYDKMKKAVEDQKAKLVKKEINLKGQIAEENTAKTAENNLKKENNKELTNQKDTKTDLKKTCEDAIKLQPERRRKRKIEAEGLTQAKEFLSGMSFAQTPNQKEVMPHFPSFVVLA